MGVFECYRETLIMHAESVRACARVYACDNYRDVEIYIQYSYRAPLVSDTQEGNAILRGTVFVSPADLNRAHRCSISLWLSITGVVSYCGAHGVRYGAASFSKEKSRVKRTRTGRERETKYSRVIFRRGGFSIHTCRDETTKCVYAATSSLPRPFNVGS